MESINSADTSTETPLGYSEIPGIQLDELRRQTNTQEEDAQHGNLNTMYGSLAVLSTVIGGGIVGIPWAMAQMGIPLGLFLNFVVAGSVQYSCLLYLEARSNVPVKIGSIYELSYVCLNRSGIFLVSAVQFINSFGLNIIYFIVFGDAAASCVAMFFYSGENVNFLTTRTCWILVLAALLVVPLLQKEMKEIKILSIILFVSIGLFLGLMVV
jgi:amino acid permease